MNTPDGIDCTAEHFRKVIHRVLYVIERYKKHEGLTDDGNCRKLNSYDYIDIDFPTDADDFKIGVTFLANCCGDTDYISGFTITPEMIEDPEAELARLFQKREQELKERIKMEAERKAQVDKERKEAQEKRDREEFKRLSAKYGEEVKKLSAKYGYEA